MNNELFYRDPYCKEFDEKVISCTKGKKYYEIILSDTSFYPEGGGQPCDLGTLNEIEVVDVKRVNNQIIHYVSQPMEPNETVHGKIQWDRRFDHMQQHTGEHIVSGLIHQKYGYENVGFHMGSEVITIDFNGQLDWSQLKEIESMANRIVYENVTVEETYPTSVELDHLQYRSKKELLGIVRIVTIPNADVCACCGTHVRNTGEVGLIKFLSIANRKDGVRIEMVCGKRAFNYMQVVYDENLKISHLLSAKVKETSIAVEKLQHENHSNQTQLHAFVNHLLEQKLEQVSTYQELYIDVIDMVDQVAVRKFCNAMLEQHKTNTCVVLMKKDSEYSYLMMTKALPLRQLIKEINPLLNGRGGGSDEMVQGSFKAEIEEIQRILKEKLVG